MDCLYRDVINELQNVSSHCKLKKKLSRTSITKIIILYKTICTEYLLTSQAITRFGYHFFSNGKT